MYTKWRFKLQLARFTILFEKPVGIAAIVHGKNDFAEGFKILLDTYLKIILLDHQNNFVKTLKIMSTLKF